MLSCFLRTCYPCKPKCASDPIICLTELVIQNKHNVSKGSGPLVCAGHAIRVSWIVWYVLLLESLSLVVNTFHLEQYTVLD